MVDKITTTKERDYAIVVFYDKAFNIYVQARGKYSKMGEKYAFWGGMIKKDETPKEAITRELREELDYEPKEISYWGDYSFVIQEQGEFHYYKLNSSIFVAPVESGFENREVKEGFAVVALPVQRVIEEKGFIKGVARFMPELQKNLVELMK